MSIQLAAVTSSESLTYSWLICGGFMVIILCVGLSMVSITNIPFLILPKKISYVSSVLFLRPTFYVIAEMCVAATSWVLMGWAMANGGDSMLFIGMQQFVTVGNSDYAVWFFQLSLLCTTVAIVSGATLSKKANFRARLGISLFHGLAVFPTLFHWVWTSWGWASAYRSVFRDDLLFGCGTIDTAGSSVIHLSAGSTGLIVLWLLKPHTTVGTDVDDVNHQMFDRRHTFANICGPLFLWIGFVGLNVAANLPAIDADYVAGRRLIMTVVSGVSAFVVGYLNVGFTCRDMEVLAKLGDMRARNIICLKCFISGLVAVGAACSTCELEGAATIGIVAAVLCITTTKVERFMSLDAAEMAVSVHFVNGVWGLIAAGLLTSQVGYEATYSDSYHGSFPTGRSVNCLGVFYGGLGYQLAANCVFVLAVLAWTTCTVIPFLLFILVVFPTAFLDDITDLTATEVMPIAVEDRLRQLREESMRSLTVEVAKQLDTETFVSKNGYSWDYVFIIPNPKQVNGNDDASSNASMIYQALRKAELELTQFVSSDRRELIIKIRAPLGIIMEKAAEVEYVMLLDRGACEKYASEIGLKIADGSELSVDLPFRPFESLHAPYVKDVNPRLYVNRVFPTTKRGDVNAHPFSTIHRLKLMKLIFEGKSADNCGLNLECSTPKRNIYGKLSEPFIIKHFPLHNKEEAEHLKGKWLSVWVMPWRQPDDSIREYFGEHIALYFKFLAHYSTGMGFASLVGIGVTFHVLYEAFNTNVSVYKSLETVKSIPFFCSFISIWSMVLLVLWKQSEAMQAFKWGMDDFEETEVNRKEYNGKEGPSFVDGKMTKHFPVAQKRRKLQISVIVTVLMMAIAIGCVAGVFALKSYLVDTVKLENGEVLSNVVNIFQVTVLRTAYDAISKHLNEQENCKTDTEYEDSMIIKLFAFNSVNAYAAVFYIAFFKEAVGDGCVENSCVGELAQTLLIVFGSQLFQSPLTQLIIPFSTRIAAKCLSNTKRPGQSQVENEALLKQYRPRDKIDDYSSLAIAFGYMTLFVAAVPFAPLLAFISTYLEIRIDGSKFLSESSRPMPTGNEDIGMWHAVFKTISYAGVFTNAAIVFYTGKYFADLTGSQRLAYAAVSCVIIFALRELVLLVIGGEIPVGLDAQKKRRGYVRRRMVKRDDYGCQRALKPADVPYPSQKRASPASTEQLDGENAYERNASRGEVQAYSIFF